LRQDTPAVSHSIPTDACKSDPELAAIVDAWPTLPVPLKAALMAIVRSASGGGGR
jgi:hypothetical protein